MPTSTYNERRSQLTTYFDQTAAAAWRALTSNDPVSRIRATVRAGRDTMRGTLLSWLPEDLHGQTLLDAGCGTGALAIEAAKRGAHVVAIDVAANLVDVARERAAEEEMSGSIDFHVGDMLADAPVAIDHIVAMDSLIHYDAKDVQTVVSKFASRARRSIIFTSAPWTPALGLMHLVGRLIPHRHHRAPSIQPIRIDRLTRNLDTALDSDGWFTRETHRVKSGFYISEGVRMELECSN